MTYLATEMLLYLLAAAVIGLMLGWLFSRSGQRRKMSLMRADLMTSLESEKAAHHEAKIALDGAETNLKKAVAATKAESQQSLARMQQAIDAERQKTQDAEAAVKQMRVDLDEALQQGRVAGREAVDEAIRVANEEKAAAAEAIARESQSRAQIEELRLLIGAEKLNAENARADLQKVRDDMLEQLATERAAHQQAKIALDDIRSALARTIGPEAVDAMAGVRRSPHDYRSEEASVQGLSGSGYNAALGSMTDVVAAGEALSNPDLHEADIEDRDDGSLELPSTIDTEPEAEDAVDADETDEPATPVVVEIEPEIEPEIEAPEDTTRPAVLLGGRPDDVDDLQAIDGIDADIEERLNQKGCYLYGQLVELTSEHLEWLVQAVDVPPEQIIRDGWEEQARAHLAGEGYDDTSDKGRVFMRPDVTSQESAAE